jgi:hypothetical protein
MSGNNLWNPVARSDMFDWDLVAEKLELGRTCSVQEPNMFGRSYWNPAMNPGKSGELRKARLSEHVRAGGRTCPVLVTGIRQGNRICPDFLESLVQKRFS